jgi:hypothetical protein
VERLAAPPLREFPLPLRLAARVQACGLLPYF